MDKKFSIPMAVLVGLLGVSILTGCGGKKESEKSGPTKSKSVAAAPLTTQEAKNPIEDTYERVRDSHYAHEKLNILEREILPKIGPNPDPDFASRAFYNLALNALRNEKYAKAVRYGEDALKHIPRSKEYPTHEDDIYLILTKAYYKQGNLSKSVEAIVNGVRFNGDKKNELYIEAWKNCESKRFAEKLKEKTDDDLKDSLINRAKNVIVSYLMVLIHGGIEPSEEDFSRGDHILTMYGLKGSSVKEAAARYGPQVDPRKVVSDNPPYPLRVDINKVIRGMGTSPPKQSPHNGGNTRLLG
ncbi:hypothetical protein J4209_04705 [Candidatus Woesearchaeota archaeon]|nr:hypothetical protein [Candidatus Woesearchaeota archaeon]